MPLLPSQYEGVPESRAPYSANSTPLVDSEPSVATKERGKVAVILNQTQQPKPILSSDRLEPQGAVLIDR
jgi:hypothetical protein